MSKMSALHPWQRLFYAGGDLSKPVILGKGGQLSAVIAFAGRDVRNSPDHDVYLSTETMSHIRADFAKEDDGFYFHDDMTTAPAEWLRAPWFLERNDAAETHINPDATAMVRLLDEHRAQRHSNLVEPVIFMTVSMQPPPKGARLFKGILDGFPDAKTAELRIDDELSKFNNRVESLVTTLNGRMGRARRLDADRIYQYTFYCQTGVWLDIEAPKESGVPFGKMFDVERIDDPRGNAFAVKAPHAGIIHVRAVTPHGMPSRVRAEFFENMCYLGGGVRWVSRSILVPPNHIRKQYTGEWYRSLESRVSLKQMMAAKIGGKEGLADPVQQEMADQAEEDVRKTAGAMYGVHLVQSVIVYRTSAEDADKAAAMIAESFINMKKLCFVEDIGTKIAVSAAMPGQVKWNVAQDTLPDDAAMTQIPISLPNTGLDVRGGMGSTKVHACHQFTIRNLFPARVDFGNGQNQHFCILAEVRKGKSTKVQLIVKDILAHSINPMVFLLGVDEKHSASQIACHAMGGSVISFSEGTAAIQPLRHIDIPERRETAVERILHMVRAHGLDDKHPKRRRRIEEALNLIVRLPEDNRTMAQYQAIVQDDVVKQCLTPFATGAYSAHIGGNRNVLGTPPYVSVDCSGLTQGNALAAVVIASLVDEISYKVQHHRGPVKCIIDEAAQVLPLIGDSIDGAYRRWPKKGGGIGIVLHSPKDLALCGSAGTTIIQNTGAWVMLADAGAVGNEAYRTAVDLNEFQVAVLAEMRQGDFMLKAGGEVRVLQTDLSELERWVLGQGGKEGADLADELASATNADDFAVQLLKKGGYHAEANWVAQVAGLDAAGFSIAAE